MRNNFINQMQMNPLLFLGAGQAALGLGQMLFSGRKKAEKQLNKLIDNSPKTTANKSILDYYNTALSRYGVDPSQSALYKRQQQDITRNATNALSYLGDRRSSTAGASSVLRQMNDATLGANVAAEQQRDRRFAELGQATGMKANEDERVFEQNEMLPYNLRVQLKGQKLQGANQRVNSGLQNLFGGAQTFAANYTPR